MTQIGYSYDGRAGLAGRAEAGRMRPSASVAQSGACHRTRRVAFRHCVPPKLFSSTKGLTTRGLRSLRFATFQPLSDRGDLPDGVSALPSGWSSEAGKHYRGRGGQKSPANTASIGDHIDQARCDCRDRMTWFSVTLSRQYRHGTPPHHARLVTTWRVDRLTGVLRSPFLSSKAGQQKGSRPHGPCAPHHRMRHGIVRLAEAPASLPGAPRRARVSAVDWPEAPTGTRSETNRRRTESRKS
jgi:hypothetical protein